MRVKITNCKDKGVDELIRKAIHFYAQQLFCKGGHRGMEAVVKLIDDKAPTYADEPEQGSCCVTHYDQSWRPIAFEIELLKTDLRSLMVNIAHEMVHVKQYANREINSNLDSWCGKKLRKSMEYWDEPWEIEAYGREQGLFQRFLKQHADLEPFLLEQSRWRIEKPKQTY